MCFIALFISVHSSVGLHKNLTDKLYAKLRTRDQKKSGADQKCENNFYGLSSKNIIQDFFYKNKIQKQNSRDGREVFTIQRTSL